MQFFKTAVLAIAAGAGVVMAQAIDPATLPLCASTCLINMQAKFGDFLCASGEDFTCLCRAPDWRVGIATCAREACGGEDTEGFQQVTAYANEKCAIVTGIPPETTAVVPAESTIAEFTPIPESTTTIAQFTPIPESSTTGPDVVPTETPGALSAPTTLLTTTKPPATTTTDGTATNAGSAANSEESSDELDGDASEGKGLSLGAKVGIAVGAGAAGVIVLALIVALCCRRRDRNSSSSSITNEKEDIQISSPMPGSGRSYASDESVPADSATGAPVSRSKSGGKSDLELTSTRYENMVPRTQPSLTQVRD